MVDEEGRSAPSLMRETEEPLEEEDFKTLKEEIQDVSDDLISASINGVKCIEHHEFTSGCSKCEEIKDYVAKYQFHRCTFTCKKKKKFMKIHGKQGLGINEDIAEDLIVFICRLRFPKYVIDETLLLLPVSKTEDPKAVQQMQKDLHHIKAYLIRRIRFFETKNEHDEKIWVKFTRMTFFEYLQDIGMFEGLSLDQTDLAKQRYINALRADIKGKAFVYLRRDTQDILTNNFNPILMMIIRANHDLQYVTEPFSCANYMTNYITKNESGYSVFLKNIEEEYKNLGDFEITKKFGTEIDQKREVSIQESAYRALGLPMSKFSRKVKYINTSHPEKRDGLMRGNWAELDNNEPLFHFSVHEYYEQRPFNGPDGIDWENMCLADVESNFERRNKATSTSFPLLEDHGHLQRRMRPAVLRYYLRYEEPEDLARGLLILFHPFRDELFDIHSRDILELFNDNKTLIEERRKQYEKNIHLVELIQEIETLNERNEAGNDHEDEEHDYEEGLIEEETTSEKDIQKFISSMKSSAKKSVETNVNSVMPTLADLREGINKLNENQRLIFDDVCERVFANNEFSEQFCLYIAGEVSIKYNSSILVGSF